MSRTPEHDVAPPDLPGYRFIKHIGAGGNAQVYLYEQNLPHRKVAVKVLNESALSEAARRRFTAEANVTADLAHRHIVQVFDANVTADGRPYIVMPYYPQPNLSVRARRGDIEPAPPAPPVGRGQPGEPVGIPRHPGAPARRGPPPGRPHPSPRHEPSPRVPPRPPESRRAGRGGTPGGP